MAKWICGGDPVVDYEMKPEGNQCAEMIYFVNLGYNHCLEKELENFQACYFNWLKEKLRPSWECDKVCEGSERTQEECVPHCERFHECTDKCAKEVHRDNVRMCFGDCIELSPHHPDGTCSENCGGHAPNGKCSCDFSCQTLGDCCGDFLNFCVAPHLKVLPAPGEKVYFDSEAFANVVNNTQAVVNAEENPGGEQTGTMKAQDPEQLATVIEQQLPEKPPEGVTDVASLEPEKKEEEHESLLQRRPRVRRTATSGVSQAAGLRGSV